jgi:hypothetical protein
MVSTQLRLCQGVWSYVGHRWARITHLRPANDISHKCDSVHGLGTVAQQRIENQSSRNPHLHLMQLQWRNIVTKITSHLLRLLLTALQCVGASPPQQVKVQLQPYKNWHVRHGHIWTMIISLSIDNTGFIILQTKRQSLHACYCMAIQVKHC